MIVGIVVACATMSSPSLAEDFQLSCQTKIASFLFMFQETGWLFSGVPSTHLIDPDVPGSSRSMTVETFNERVIELAAKVSIEKEQQRQTETEQHPQGDLQVTIDRITGSIAYKVLSDQRETADGFEWAVIFEESKGTCRKTDAAF